MIRWILVLMLMCGLGSFRSLHWDEPPDGVRAMPPDQVQVVITDIPQRTEGFPGQEFQPGSGEVKRQGPGEGAPGVQQQLQGR